MSSNKKKNIYSSKIIRRFDEDIWGQFAVCNKNSKTLNYIFEIYKNDFRYRTLLRNRKFFFSSKKFKFLYKINNEDKELKRKKRTLKINNYLNKLKLRRFYGNLGQRQFKRLFRNLNVSTNILGQSFPYFLESRLDVVLYRSNLFGSIISARQVINHKKVLVNGIVINKPNYRLSVGDIVLVRDFKNYYDIMKLKLKRNVILTNYPKYLEVNYKLASIILISLPKKEEIPYPFFINIDSILYGYLK